MKINRIALAALCLMALPLMAQVVIISVKNPISKMTKDQVAQLYLGQVHTFISGAQAEPLDLGEDSVLRKTFYQVSLNKAPAQMKAYWAKLEFSGSARSPRVILTSAEVVKLVAENPKYLGYVEAAAVTSGVKVVYAVN